MRGGVVERLKEFYQPGKEFSRSAVNINEVVQSTVLLTQPKWEAEAQARGSDIRVETQLKKVPDIFGSEYQLREVMTNLMFNAVDAMPEGGLVSIKTYSSEGSVHIELSDTGIGMTEETLSRCRESFFSTKGDVGTGLGLSMVQEIVGRHNGEFGIRSTVGLGTTVTLHIPIGSMETQGEGEVEEPGSVASLDVLVVDDHVGSQEMLRQFLRLDGHNVVVVDTGREAIEQLKNSIFDLVMTDRAMPDINGDRVAVAAASADSPARVIMLTGFGDVMVLKNNYPSGVDLILQKPLGHQELRLAISDLLSDGEPPASL